MSVSYASSKLGIPPGFEAILEGLCRQVLKEQPEQIIPFAAEYFAAKLEARNGSNQTQQTTLGEGSQPADLETPAVSNGEVLLVEETSPESVERPASGQEMAKTADDVEMSANDANKDKGVLEEDAVKESDGSMDEEVPAAATEGEGVSDVNEASIEVPKSTDVAKADVSDAEEAKADLNAEPSGEDHSSVDDKGEESESVPDKPSPVADDSEPTVADGGLDEDTTIANSAKVNVSADVPVSADGDGVKDEGEDMASETEEAGDREVVEGNGDNMEESKEGEVDEVQEPAKDSASVEEADHDVVGDKGEGEGDDEVVEGEEPVKEADDGGSGEGSDHSEVEEKNMDEEEKSSSPVQPETEES